MNDYRCAHCGAPLWIASLEPDNGELIARCALCNAKNIVVAMLDVVGWRE